ncbi:response regulator receiver protein [Leptolyngbya sp. Heron Island J]|uniref:response regulator n=1 Tax=Leptolyngbya sp. Heron Island J TaxID=1385935 RepID=UPI0003B9544A|nr:response regulator [Leptolyngbya sp. Heron Island J]ESA33895.1 response regulator receiver protein [Leptolyngbya sp. Heron Island J]
METPENERLVLVIDDQPDHLQIIKRVLAESTVPCQVVAIPSSHQAIEFLHHRGDYCQASRPDLILLDAHLADGDSQTVLLEVKTDNSLRRIPTIILSPTSDQESVISSYQLQCNSYVVEPHDLINLTDVIRVIESFWLNIVTLPSE